MKQNGNHQYHPKNAAFALFSIKSKAIIAGCTTGLSNIGKAVPISVH